MLQWPSADQECCICLFQSKYGGERGAFGAIAAVAVVCIRKVTAVQTLPDPIDCCP